MYIAISLVLSVLTFFFIFPQARGNFLTNMLNEHNKYRSEHGCPNLVLDESLSNECKTFAKNLANETNRTHSNEKYGENLCATPDNPIVCVKLWYDEIKHYNYHKGGFSPETRHFTQLIWKSSRTLGAGLYVNEVGLSFVVARYKPPGNIKGLFKENVPRPNCSCNRHFNLNYLALICWIFIALLISKYFLNYTDFKLVALK